MRRIFLVFILFLALVVVGGLYKFLVPKNLSGIKFVQIDSAAFELEIADTPAERMKGLSGRKNFPENKGMLFIFQSLGNYGFWMKDMQIPLDILWIKGDQLLGIDKNIAATSTKIYYPPEMVDRVLEINAGLADKLGLKVGDMVSLQRQ